ncbi:hypothetical protein ABBQ38_012678 [Trebouxia sp. C0009 RCD-2024]
MISMPGAQCCLCLRMLAAYMEVFIAARCSLIFDTLRPGGSTLTACQLAAQDQPTHNTGALRYDCEFRHSCRHCLLLDLASSRWQ